MTSSAIIQKLWNYCNVLRDDGMSYGEYVEQLTYLLFLKMTDERTRPPHSKPSLLKRDSDDLVKAVATNLTRATSLRRFISRQALSGQLVEHGSKNNFSLVHIHIGR